MTAFEDLKEPVNLTGIGRERPIAPNWRPGKKDRDGPDYER